MDKFFCIRISPVVYISDTTYSDSNKVECSLNCCILMPDQPTLPRTPTLLLFIYFLFSSVYVFGQLGHLLFFNSTLVYYTHVPMYRTNVIHYPTSLVSIRHIKNHQQTKVPQPPTPPSTHHLTINLARLPSLVGRGSR